MRLLGKLIGLLALLLVLALVSLGFMLTYVINPNDYKSQIQYWIRAQTGLELSIGGNIGWSLFPWLGLQLEDVHLSRPQAPEQPFAQLRHLRFSVQVMPLLQQRLRMQAIDVEGLALNLVRDAQGQANWQPVTASREEERAASEFSAHPTQDAGFQAYILDVERVQIRDARIRYQDLAQGQHIELEGIHLLTGPLREAEATPIHLEFQGRSQQPRLNGHLVLNAQLRVQTALQRYQLEGVQAQGNLLAEAWFPQPIDLSMQGLISADLKNQQAEWSSFRVGLNNLRVLGDLKAEHLDREPRFSGALSVARFDLNEFLSSLGWTPAQSLPPSALRSVEAVIQGSATEHQLNLEHIRFQVDGQSLEAQLALNGLEARPRLQLDLRGDAINGNLYSQVASEPSATPEALQGLTSSLDGPVPELPSQSLWPTTRLPLEWLRWDSQVKLALARFTLGAQVFDQPRLEVEVEEGQLALKQMQAQMQGGQIHLHGHVQIPAEDQPILSVSGSIQQVPIEYLLGPMKQAAPISGQLQATGAWQARGISLAAWAETVSGSLDWSITSGMLWKAGLDQQLCRAIAAEQRTALTQVLQPTDIAFRSLSGQVLMEQGLGRMQNIRLEAPGLLATGEGRVFIPTLGADYYLTAQLEGLSRLPDAACQQQGSTASKLSWPLHCRGPLVMGVRGCRIEEPPLEPPAS